MRCFVLLVFAFLFALGRIEESDGRKILHKRKVRKKVGSYDPFVLKNLFSTKTKYWDQKYPETYQTQRRKLSSISSLQLVQINQVTRHGSRYPTQENMDKIQKLVKKIQSSVNIKSLPKWLQTYKLPYNLSMEGELAPAGAEEVYEFGRRTRLDIEKWFPTLFSKETFILEHTFKSRTKQSAISFARGFFENPHQVEYIAKSKEDDLTLRFYDHCPRYEKQVKSNPNTTIQNDLYFKSKQMQKNMKILRDALGLKQKKDVQINAEDCMTIFSACAFDLALYNKENQWCSLLKEDSIRSMDFADDLETFYTLGYGYEINYEMAGVLLKDIFNSMKAFVQNKTKVIGNFRFAHAETLLPLQCLLGYRKDPTDLMADFSWQQIQQRQFFSSKLVPFAANIQFRLYVSNESMEYFVQILLNEKEAPIHGCQNKIFCSFKELETIWAKYLNHFHFKQLCSL
jgi:multiple inositol-polyphosphate phosphatase/2,3-bisphosphoglycerate 3-phosphatase